MSDRARVTLSITGVVQSVGFRPFVARTAREHGLAGQVHNTGDGRVEVALEGPRPAIETAIETIERDPPSLARIDTCEVTWTDPAGATTFEIVASTGEAGGAGAIPPDTATCEACMSDVRDPDSRYADYWATSCVDCGPRYTVIESLPVDRERTTMAAFPMCADCRAAYEDPTDRRFHAQTIACPACGPTLTLRADGTDRVEGPAAVGAAARRIRAGEIVAVKGIGGTHLVCSSRPAVVERLRARSNRPGKPFALMAPDLASVRSFATVGEAERAALESIRRPIVLLDRRDDGWLAPVAPGLHTVGVMLPYAALHHRLFETIDAPLVMTSANRPGEPMAIDRDGIAEIAMTDAALVHDRTIATRCDDSVVRFAGGDRQFLRRSRGWVPERLPRPDRGPAVLAVGAEFDATVAVGEEDWIRPSQHVGDVDGPATLAAHADAIEHLLALFDLEPAIVARDAHPEFLTSERARAYADDPDCSIDRVETVQHHHAHAAALLAEHGRDRATVLALDGTGHGADGTVWGGEVLAAGRRSADRVGSIAPFRLPGGEAAVRTPARSLASLLEEPDRIDAALARAGIGAGAAVRRQADRGVNAPVTTSAGRVLDAAAALLGVCQHRSYEGQPAMALEAVAHGATPLERDPPLGRVDGRPVLDAAALLQWIDDRRDRESTDRLAATVQDVLARGLATIAVEAARERGHDAIGLTGGVAYNEAIHRTVAGVVTDAGLEWLAHDRVPPGDAGLSYGQAVVASARATGE